jgi:hypothetical protein
MMSIACSRRGTCHTGVKLDFRPVNGAHMPVREVEYKGMMIRAAAFEVVGTGLFVNSLLVARIGVPRSGNTKLFEPPSPDGFFRDSEEALESALAFARAIVDGEVPDHTVEDL